MMVLQEVAMASTRGASSQNRCWESQLQDQSKTVSIPTYTSFNWLMCFLFRLSAVDKEVVRLIGQHLTNIGLKTSADVLMHEAGCRLDQPSAATFKRHVMNGDWVMAVKSKTDGDEFKVQL